MDRAVSLIEMPGRSREFRKVQDWFQELADAAKVPRPITQPSLIRGIGSLRLQLVIEPEHGSGSLWEIRQNDRDRRLYRSALLREPPGHCLGYTEVEAQGQMLAEFVERFRSLQVPIRPHPEDGGGLDGVFYQLALFGGYFSEVRFQWWCSDQHPPDWAELVRIVFELERYCELCDRWRPTRESL